MDCSYHHSFQSFTTLLTLLRTPRSLSSYTHSHHDRYQGESNVGAPAPMEGADYYACALPTLIHDWRNSLISPIADKPIPFFVVELSAYVAPLCPTLLSVSLCSTVLHCVQLCYILFHNALLQVYVDRSSTAIWTCDMIPRIALHRTRPLLWCECTTCIAIAPDACGLTCQSRLSSFRTLHACT